jgi:hypothetical protein
MYHGRTTDLFRQRSAGQVRPGYGPTDATDAKRRKLDLDLPTFSTMGERPNIFFMHKRLTLARLKQLRLDNMVTKDQTGNWIESQTNYLREAGLSLRKSRVYPEDTHSMKLVKAVIERRGREIEQLLPGEVEGPDLRTVAFKAIRKLEFKQQEDLQQLANMRRTAACDYYTTRANGLSDALLMSFESEVSTVQQLHKIRNDWHASMQPGVEFPDLEQMLEMEQARLMTAPLDGGINQVITPVRMLDYDEQVRSNQVFPPGLFWEYVCTKYREDEQKVCAGVTQQLMNLFPVQGESLSSFNERFELYGNFLVEMNSPVPDSMKYLLFIGVLDKAYASNKAFYDPFTFWRTTGNANYMALWAWCKSFIDERGDIIAEGGDSNGARGALPVPFGAGGAISAFAVGVPGGCQFCPRASHTASTCFHNPQSPAYKPGFVRRSPPALSMLPRSPMLSHPQSAGPSRPGQSLPTGRMIPTDLASLKQCYNCFGYGHEKAQCPTAARQPALPAGITGGRTSIGSPASRIPWTRGQPGLPAVRANAVETSNTDEQDTTAPGVDGGEQRGDGMGDTWYDGGDPSLGYTLQHEFYGVSADD